MVHHGVDIGWEERLVVVVDVHGRVGPPQKGLGQGGAVVQADVDFEAGAVGGKAKAGERAGAKHPFDLVEPDGFAAVGVGFDAVLDGQEGAGAVVLGPVELDAA